jgi:hypothetical protein
VLGRARDRERRSRAELGIVSVQSRAGAVCSQPGFLPSPQGEARSSVPSTRTLEPRGANVARELHADADRGRRRRGPFTPLRALRAIGVREPERIGGAAALPSMDAASMMLPSMDALGRLPDHPASTKAAWARCWGATAAVSRSATWQVERRDPPNVTRFGSTRLLAKRVLRRLDHCRAAVTRFPENVATDSRCTNHATRNGEREQRRTASSMRFQRRCCCLLRWQECASIVVG